MCVCVCLSVDITINVCVYVFKSMKIHPSCSATHSSAPWCPLLRLAPALPPHCSSSTSSSSSSPMLVPLPSLFLFVRLHHDVTVATVVARGAISQCPAVLAEVSWVNQCHYIFVPGLGSSALIGRAGPGSEEVIGRGAPDGEADSDGGPMIAVLLHLAMVDTTMRQLSLTN